MHTFNYSNVWFTGSLIALLASAGLFFIMAAIAGNKDTRKLYVITWSIFLIHALVIPFFVIANKDKVEASDEYRQSISKHIKETAGFDKISVEDKFEMKPNAVTTYDVTTGDSEGKCYAMYPENAEDELEIGCTSELVDLKDSKEAVVEAAKEIPE